MSKLPYIINKDSTDSDSANLLINGEISDWWGVGLAEVNNRLAETRAKNISVQINSVGGSVTEGLAIRAFLKGYPANITTSGFGLVASIATVVLLASKKSSMASGSWFMIHEASIHSGGYAADLRKDADLLENITDSISDIYVKAISDNKKLVNDSIEETKAMVLGMMKEETWLTAEQALEYGFINKVTEGVEFLNKSNALDVYNKCVSFKNAPIEFLNKIKNIADMPTKDETMFERFKNLFKASETELEAAISDLEKVEEAKKTAIEEAPKDNTEINALLAKMEALETSNKDIKAELLKAQTKAEELAAAPSSTTSTAPVQAKKTAIEETLGVGSEAMNYFNNLAKSILR